MHMPLANVYYMYLISRDFIASYTIQDTKTHYVSRDQTSLR